MRIAQPVVVLLLLFVVGLFVLLLSSESEDRATPGAGDDKVHRAGLTGRMDDATDAADPLAELTDAREILALTKAAGVDAVVERLAALARASPELVGVLIERLREEHDVERMENGWNIEAVRRSLVAIGKPAVQPLIDALGDDEEELRRRVAIVLGEMKNVAAPAVPVLLAHLEGKERDIYVRNAMIEALGGIGPAAKDALPWLHKMTRDPNERTALRCKTADALFAVGGASEDVFETWRIVLVDGGPDLRQTVLEDIGESGVAAQSMLRSVLAVLAEDDATLHTGAIFALSRMESEDERVLRALRAIFESKDFDAPFAAAAKALASIGDQGREVLWQRIEFARPFARVEGVSALMEQGGDSDRLAALLVPIVDENFAVAQRALELLPRLKAKASLVFPALDKRVLHDQDSWLRVHAVRVLGSLREPTKETTEALLRALDEPNEVSVYQSALAGIDGSANPDKRVFDIVVDGPKRTRWGRMDAIRALGTYATTEHAKDAVDALIAVLRDEEMGGQAITIAARSLENYGFEAKRALSDLRAARKRWSHWTYVTERVDASIEAIDG